MSEVLPPGAELANYRIEQMVGRGGMGVVYLAEHVHLGRRAALKTISGVHAQTRQFRERFIRESRLAAQIDHSNIVPIYDAGEAEGQLYLAMRFVDGEDLDQLIQREARSGSSSPSRSSPRSPPRSTPPTPRGWSTATSSPPTSCSSPPAGTGRSTPTSPTSG
jgi:serine/threonine protein kinase